MISKANNKDQTENDLTKIMITTWNQNNDGSRKMETISNFQEYIKELKDNGYDVHIGTHSNGTVAADGSSSGHWASRAKEFDLYGGNDQNNHNYMGFLVATKDKK